MKRIYQAPAAILTAARTIGVLALLSLPAAPVLARGALPTAVGDVPVPSLSPMIKKVSPAIVNIATRGTIKRKGPAESAAG